MKSSLVRVEEIDVYPKISFLRFCITCKKAVSKIVNLNSHGVFQGCVIQSFTRRSASLALKSDKSPNPVSPHPLLSLALSYL